jgi:hypothetical protein
MKFAFETLQDLLGKPADDPAVIELIGFVTGQIERIEHLGYREFMEHGVSVVFKEAPWMMPPPRVSNSKMLYLDAFHFHQAGHEGHYQYAGQFPGGIVFGDTEEEAVRKLGQSTIHGGGGFSQLLKMQIPRWLKYPLRSGTLHLQLGADGNVEMVTLMYS